ncbi:MAG TPA: hypothetical protein VME43_26445 [Bryobacteraceae bacterium]|nr:hypothetical protein [Bryobacteraceae bacterium]
MRFLYQFFSSALLLGTIPLHAQAFNAASGGSAVAPGSLVSVYGKFDPATIGGALAEVLLWDGNPDDILNLSPVPILYQSVTQINIFLPDSAGPGSQLEPRTWDTPAGSPIPLNVAAQAPGIFVNPTPDCSIAAAGCAQALRRGIITDTNYALIGSGNPAHPGQALVIWATGLGVVPTWPQVSILPNNGNPATANILYTGHTTIPGLDQVNITMPSGASIGSSCSLGVHLEVQLSMKSLTTGIQSNTVPLPVITDSCN